MNYPALAILLLAVGLAMLVAEIFIPSGGMILVAAIICLGFALMSAYHAWWESNRVFWWSYISLMVLLLPGVVGGAFYLLPKTTFGKNILAVPPNEEEVKPFLEEEQRLNQLIGKQGQSSTMMTPGGMVIIDGERIHAESEGMLIDPNQTVEVVAIKGNRLVVRLSNGEEPKGDQNNSVASSSGEEHPMDFDVPQS